jgi:hypothetical protein
VQPEGENERANSLPENSAPGGLRRRLLIRDFDRYAGQNCFVRHSYQFLGRPSCLRTNSSSELLFVAGIGFAAAAGSCFPLRCSFALGPLLPVAASPTQGIAFGIA